MVHRNSLAAIEPYRFRAGQSGNPGGRAKGVVFPAEYLGSLVGMTSDELEVIRDDTGEPASKRMAAGMILDGLDGSISPRTRREAVAEVMDRTTGKAQQPHRIQVGQEAQPTMIVLAESSEPCEIADQADRALPSLERPAE